MKLVGVSASSRMSPKYSGGVASAGKVAQEHHRTGAAPPVRHRLHVP